MFVLHERFGTARRILRASILTGVVTTMGLLLATSAMAQQGREVLVQTVGELYDAVNLGSENDVIVLSAGTFVLDDDRGPLRLKRGMVLQGKSETETVIDGTNLSLAFPLSPADNAEGVIEVAPGNRLAQLTVQGAPLSIPDGGAAVVLMRPAAQGTSGGRMVMQDVIIDGGFLGFLGLHRFADDDKAHSVVDIEHSVIRNALSIGVSVIFWQGVRDSSFHITVNRCRLAGSAFGLGVFTSAPTVFTGDGDNNNEAMVFSSDSMYEDNGMAGAIFLPRLGANGNRFSFTSQNDVFAGNGDADAVRAFGSGFATAQAPGNDNHIILRLLSTRFNDDTIRVGGTFEPVPSPSPYPGTGNRVDLLVRQGESNLPSEDDFLIIENDTDANPVRLIGGHIQVEYGP
jgi:hypothetical protein